MAASDDGRGVAVDLRGRAAQAANAASDAPHGMSARQQNQEEQQQRDGFPRLPLPPGHAPRVMQQQLPPPQPQPAVAAPVQTPAQVRRPLADLSISLLMLPIKQGFS